MSRPILSIITINRNNAEGLRQTIESVLKQENVNQEEVEYIVIDGASTDTSVDVIKSFEDNPTFPLKITKWISEPDTGIYNAMNKGISMANGEYLHMLNSGDFYEPFGLRNVLNNLKDNPQVLLCAVNQIKNKIKECVLIKFPEVLSFTTIFHQGFIYKKQFHEIYGLYSEKYKYASDYDFTLKVMFKKNINISYLYTPTVNFLFGGIGNSDASQEEFEKIQFEYNIKKDDKKINLKKIIKMCIPYGLLKLINKF